MNNKCKTYFRWAYIQIFFFFYLALVQLDTNEFVLRIVPFVQF